MFKQIGATMDQGISKAWDWVTDEDNREIVIYVGLIVGALALYSKSFNYGYNLRVCLEKACDADLGTKIVETLANYN